MMHQQRKQLHSKRRHFSLLLLVALSTALPAMLSLYGATGRNDGQRMMATNIEAFALGVSAITPDFHHYNATQQRRIERRPQEYYPNEFDTNIHAKYKAGNEDELSIADAMGLPAILEMEDPRGGRDQQCLHWFFDIWNATTNHFPNNSTIHKQETSKNSVGEQSPFFSVEPFYDWLDYGSGKYIRKAGSCTRRRLNQRCCYARYNSSERSNAVVEIHVKEHKETATRNQVVTVTLASTGEPVKPGLWQFVWGTDRKVYLDRAGKFPVEKNANATQIEYKKVGHASIFRGRPVLHAGEMFIDGKNFDGHVVAINARSGHYKPRLRHIRNFFLWMHGEYGIERYSSGVSWQPRPNLAKETTEEEWDEVFAIKAAA